MGDAQQPRRNSEPRGAVAGLVYSRNRVLFTPRGSRIRVCAYAAHERHAPHAHDRTTVTLILCGSLEERVAGRVRTGGPLSLVVRPAGIEHANTFGSDGALTLQATLSPRDESRFDVSGRALGAWCLLDVPA